MIMVAVGFVLPGIMRRKRTGSNKFGSTALVVNTVFPFPLEGLFMKKFTPSEI